MQAEKSAVDALLLFRQRDKFSTSAWNKRGLNPSGTELCEELSLRLNKCADSLINALQHNASEKHLKSILKLALASFDKHQYDREEKEFICDLFHEMATTVKVDFKDNLNQWLYGYVLAALIKILKFLKPERIAETLKQPCSKCQIQLETHILIRQHGIPETSWIIGKCNNCGELNLLLHGPNAKEKRFGNYQWFDSLRMDEYTYEEALTRLEQIKFFRK